MIILNKFDFDEYLLFLHIKLILSFNLRDCSCVVVCVVAGGAGLLLCDVMRMWRVNCGWSQGGVLVTALVEVVQSTQCVQ